MQKTQLITGIRIYFSMLFISKVAWAVPTYFQRDTRVIMFQMITKMFTFFIQSFGEKISVQSAL